LLIRLMSGRQWALASSEPDLEAEMVLSSDGALNLRLSAPSHHTTISLQETEHQVGNRINEVTYALLQALSADELNPSSESNSIDEVGNKLFEAIPKGAGFHIGNAARGSMSLVLDDDLVQLPWEITRFPGGRILCIEHQIGRTVVSDRVASRQLSASMILQAMIFAPADVDQTSKLAFQNLEVIRVRARMKSVGINVEVLPPDTKKEDWLDSLPKYHLFHYSGHVLYRSDQPKLSGIQCIDGVVTSAEINESLANENAQTFLAFLNGCEGSREAAWGSVEGLAGLASAFLRNATFVIGPQWPVSDAYSGEFAAAFYDNFLPNSQRLFWRWLAGKPIQGGMLGEAVVSARENLYRTRPESSMTWLAYVLYGDPNVCLHLKRNP
jgi:hypothetical protein